MTTQTGWFITGTDTGIGKTQVTLALMSYLQQHGYRVAGMKPIATGCEVTEAGLRNADAVALLQASSLVLPYSQVNPYAFLPPIAPHLAAAREKQVIDIEKIIRTYYLLSRQVDITLVEGVGGWRVPLNAHQSLKDIVLSLDLSVILVVGLRLGCINHALLTAEVLQRDGCRFAGWIINQLTPDEASHEVIESLQQRLAAPLLGHLPFATDDTMNHFHDLHFPLN